MKRSSPVKAVAALLLAMAMLLLAACAGETPATGQTEANTLPQANAPFEAPPYQLAFADYAEYASAAKPQVPAYSVSANLANVVNRLQFMETKDKIFSYYHTNDISSAAIALLEKNGFAVSDSRSWAEYFSVYEENRYNYVPSFITTDSAVHTFHLMFDYVLKDLEQSKLFAVLRALTTQMLQSASAQYAELKGTDFENAALRNWAYFTVAQQLLNSKAVVPAEVKTLVSEELAFIKAHSGPAASPVINYGQMYIEDARLETYNVDYSQFVPRSHYTQTETLQQYFKAMQWYGQLTFRSKYEDEVKSALLMTSALAADETARQAWNDIFEPTSFFVGDCDDITPYQYKAALQTVYDDKLGDLNAVTDAANFAKAFEIIQKMEPPKINSVPIFQDVEDRDAAITGLRFLGQRFTIDASVFQRLMDRDVPGRWLPSSLDIPSAFGSAEAQAILKPETNEFPAYATQLESVRNDIKSLPAETWHSNLYWSWMHMLRPFTDAQDGEGYPFFMQNNAWLRKELNTFQGSWTELKHDTLLYAKQPMGEMGAGGDEAPPPPDDRGYVEPNPIVFGRLAALVQQTIDGLQARKLLTDAAKEALNILNGISKQLTTIAEKELENKSLTAAEYEFIRTYGGELEHIWQTAKKDEMESAGGVQFMFLELHPDAVVADVATDPGATPAGPRALEEATGFAKEIYTAFPRDGKVVLARGVVFSQYEFTVPADKRLTNDAWHKQLNAGGVPAYAAWKTAFITDIADDQTGNTGMQYSG